MKRHGSALLLGRHIKRYIVEIKAALNEAVFLIAFSRVNVSLILLIVQSKDGGVIIILSADGSCRK